MKTSNKIWILIWNLPLLVFAGLTLSSNLCGLNNWSSWFIAMGLYFNRSYTDLKHDSLEHKVDKNNYITITKVKDSWTREEVIELLFKCQDEVEYPETYYEPCNEEEENIKEFKNDMEEWIEQNL